MAAFLFFVVFAVGGVINNENAATKVQNLDDVKAAVVHSIENAKPYDSGTLKNINGNFGNP